MDTTSFLHTQGTGEMEITMSENKAANSVFELPKPGGQFPTGTMRLAFTDEKRRGIFTKDDAPRELAVQVWYPAKEISGQVPVNYTSPEVGNLMGQGNTDFVNRINNVKTNSFMNVPLAGENEKYPVLFFSHGYTTFEGISATLMEELASRGYIIFSIAHTFEAIASTFPDGKIVPFNAEHTSAFKQWMAEFFKIDGRFATAEEMADPVFFKSVFQKSNQKDSIIDKSAVIWRDDTIFIADQVEKLASGGIESIFTGRLDMDKIGVFGHSFGGANAGNVCAVDKRFKAFINMDGSPYGEAVCKVVKQPFMVMSNSFSKCIYDCYHPEQTNYMVVSIEGSKHNDFTDSTIIFNDVKQMLGLGKIDGYRQTQIVNDYTVAFFNKHLKGVAEPLIDQQLSKYSEVSVLVK